MSCASHHLGQLPFYCAHKNSQIDALSTTRAVVRLAALFGEVQKSFMKRVKKKEAQILKTYPTFQ